MAMQLHKERDRQARSDMKQFWLDQMNATAQQRQKERDCENILRTKKVLTEPDQEIEV